MRRRRTFQCWAWSDVEESLIFECLGDRKEMSPAPKKKLNESRVIREEVEEVAMGATAGPQGGSMRGCKGSDVRRQSSHSKVSSKRGVTGIKICSKVATYLFLKICHWLWQFRRVPSRLCARI
jgi:hypothetical protein